MTLYHLTDHVYLKPKTSIDIVLRIKQPENRYTPEGKSLCYLQTAKDFALFKVMKDCFRSELTKDVGYEAQLAHVTYSMSTIEEMAVRISISGFSDKLFDFTKIYIDQLFKCAEDNHFMKKSVIQSMAKNKQIYANNNVEVDEKASHNRLLMLIPHSFHDKLMEKELQKLLDLGDDFDMD